MNQGLMLGLLIVSGCGASGQAPERTWRALAPPSPVTGWSLRDAAGERFTEADLRGHTTVVAIGSTRGTDAVPGVLEALAADPELQAVFVAVDPDADSDAVAARLRAAPAVRGLMGDPGAIDHVMASLRTSWAPSTTEPGAIDHSTSLAVIGADGELLGWLHRPDDAARVRRDLDQLLP